MIGGLKPYPAYKDSGIPWLGELPEEWDVRRLGSITTPVSRRGRPDLPLLSVVRDKGVIRREKGDGNYNVVPEDLTSYKVVKPGDLVINKMKAWQGSLGVADGHGIVSPAYFVYRVHVLGRSYAHALLRSWPYIGAFSAASEGIRVDQWDLSSVGMKAIPVLVPPRGDQALIVRFLDHADAQIQRFVTAKERSIELREEERQAIVNRAITRGFDPDASFKPSGIQWLGEIPAHWDVVPLGLRYSVQLGKMLDTKRITGESLVPYLRNTDVQWGEINTEDLPEMDIASEELSRYTVRKGDLLVCEGGEVGRAAIWGGSSTVGFQKALHRLRPRVSARDNPRFLYYALRAAAGSGIFKADGNESTIAHLTAEKLKRHRFPFPPVAEQDAIAERLDCALDRCDGARSAAAAHIELLREYRTRLVADVVTGRLDVRKAAERLPDDPDVADAAFDGGSER